MTDQQKKNRNEEEPQSNLPRFKLYWMYLFLIVLLGSQYFIFNQYKAEETSWHDFKEKMLVSDDVESIVVINKERVEITLKEDRINEEKYPEITNKQSTSSLLFHHRFGRSF